MSILAAILVILQVIGMSMTTVQHVRQTIRPPRPHVASLPPPVYNGPAPTAIPHHEDDVIKYWWDPQRQQWCCVKNGTLFVWGPTQK